MKGIEFTNAGTGIEQCLDKENKHLYLRIDLSNPEAVEYKTGSKGAAKGRVSCTVGDKVHWAFINMFSRPKDTGKSYKAEIAKKDDEIAALKAQLAKQGK